MSRSLECVNSQTRQDMTCENATLNLETAAVFWRILRTKQVYRIPTQCNLTSKVSVTTCNMPPKHVPGTWIPLPTALVNNVDPNSHSQLCISTTIHQPRRVGPCRKVWRMGELSIDFPTGCLELRHLPASKTYFRAPCRGRWEGGAQEREREARERKARPRVEDHKVKFVPPEAIGREMVEQQMHGMYWKLVDMVRA